MGTSAELPRAAARWPDHPQGGATEITKVRAARLRLYGFDARGLAECTAAETGFDVSLDPPARVRACGVVAVQWQSGCYQAASRWSKLGVRGNSSVMDLIETSQGWWRPIDPSGRWNFGRFFRLLPRRNNAAPQ